MRQVLFRIPPWTDNGVPVYGFGLMLFAAFLVCTWVAARRAEREGFAGQLMWDLAIWLFVGGILGARTVYMIQYGIPFWPPWNFFKIWEGGLVFYGSALGGLAALGLAYRFELKKHGLGRLQVLDIVAPAVALGLCLGRVGCLLNGCCYGHVACASCPAIRFPLSAPPRLTLVRDGYQTAAGFTLASVPDRDPLSVVGQVEPDSPAERAGLRPGDRIIGLDGQPNLRLLEVRGPADALQRLAEAIGPPTARLRDDQAGGIWQYALPDQDAFQKAYQATTKVRLDDVLAYDSLWDAMLRPRSQAALTLKVQHANGAEEELPPFAPRTLGLHPTQVYETISMALLFFVLCAYTPLRRRYGEVFVLLLFGYAIHRFINEQLRNDTDPITIGRFETHLTLSQNISILVLALAIVLAIVVWRRPADFPRPQAGANA